MKKPIAPPPLREDHFPRLMQLISRSPALAQAAVDDQGRYLHWDQLRHKQPPEGLTIEDYWHCVKFSRAAKRQNLPLSDEKGKPFFFSLVDSLSEFLHVIDMGGGGFLRTTGEMRPDADGYSGYLVGSLMEEAIHSSLLEGASVTRRDARAMLQEKRSPQTIDERMILNNYQAIERVRELVAGKEPLTIEMIKELHRILTEDTMGASDCGRIRDCDDDDKKGEFGVYDNADNEMAHRPPPWRDLPVRLRRLCDFANGKKPDQAKRNESGFIHPAVRAIALHFLFAYEHPFMDGNGRTARALFYWSMLRSGYWMIQYVSISEIIKRSPLSYYSAFLRTESDENDLTYFVLQQVDVIRKAIDAFRGYVSRRQSQVSGVRSILQGSAARGMFNFRQLDVLGDAVSKPKSVYTIKAHQSLKSVSYQTARSDLLFLASKGLLRQGKSGKTFVFEAADNLERKLRDLSP